MATVISSSVTAAAIAIWALDPSVLTAWSVLIGVMFSGAIGTGTLIISKSRHHMFGKRWSPEQIENFRQRSSGENNPMYGRSGPLAPNFGKKHSEEYKAMMSARKKQFWASKTKEERHAIGMNMVAGRQSAASAA
jgi:hypothetical protein